MDPAIAADRGAEYSAVLEPEAANPRAARLSG